MFYIASMPFSRSRNCHIAKEEVHDIFFVSSLSGYNQVRTNSVSSPYQLRTKFVPIDTEMVRT